MDRRPGARLIARRIETPDWRYRPSNLLVVARPHGIFFCPRGRLLANNELDKIKADSLFEKLPELQHLDLRKNKISRVEASAFQGAHKLTDL